MILKPRPRNDIEEAIDIFGHMEGYELVDLVHEEHGAWWNAYARGRNQLIDHRRIRSEFSDR